MVETFTPKYEEYKFTYGPDIKASCVSPEIKEPHDLITALGADFINDITSKMLELKINLPNGTPDFLKELDTHKGSEAKYLFDNYKNVKEGEKKEKDRILISYIPPFSETSTHYHIEGMVEEYYLLAGELNLHTQDKELIDRGLIEKGQESEEFTITREGLIVLPGIIHRARTGEQGALTLIRMRNAAFVDESKHHIPASFC